MAKYHKWNDNKCVKCGLERKPRALSKNLNMYAVGSYLYDYLVDGKWMPKNQPCEDKKVDASESNCTIHGVINCPLCGSENTMIVGMRKAIYCNDCEEHSKGCL